MVLVCDFSHLTQISYSVNSISVRFSYSNHVFTSGTKIPETPSHRFLDGRFKIRAFDEQRYKDSLLLASYLRNLPKSRIYDDTHGNAFYFPSGMIIYRVILSMKRERKGVAIRVESAHQMNVPPVTASQKKMNFPIAVKRVYQNEPIFPKKR